MDRIAVVVKRVFVAFSVQGVALRTADHHAGQGFGQLLVGNPPVFLGQAFCSLWRDFGHAALLPAGHDSRVQGYVAFQAGSRVVTEGKIRPGGGLGQKQRGKQEDHESFHGTLLAWYALSPFIKCSEAGDVSQGL
jgi:hypothetical protein